MSNVIAQLLSELTPDPWRKEVGFSPEMEEAQKVLLDNRASHDDLRRALGAWLHRHQPCLFGNIAASRGFLSYCILTEADIQIGDSHINDKIESARKSWTREGFEGKKSGFVVLLVSERLTYAIPDETTKKIALRLGTFYLKTELVSDRVFLEDIFLEKPGTRQTTWRWDAGVNYFSAQGDKRWWQDHRIPGGIAFSVNSVGHMVKSQILSKSMVEMEKALGAPEEGWAFSKVGSLATALEFAMRTISRASLGPSGKATELLSLPQESDSSTAPKCPYNLHTEFKNNDYCSYLGRYHTDYTIPSEYFRADVTRPAELPNHILDFTYLFHRDVENPAFITMGEGQQIRAGDEIESSPDTRRMIVGRMGRVAEREVKISDYARLVSALESP